MKRLLSVGAIVAVMAVMAACTPAAVVDPVLLACVLASVGGRVILLTGSFERCELGQEQIHSYGADPAMRRSAGAMSAIVEPMA